jgi:hypothetical protein
MLSKPLSAVVSLNPYFGHGGPDTVVRQFLLLWNDTEVAYCTLVDNVIIVPIVPKIRGHNLLNSCSNLLIVALRLMIKHPYKLQLIIDKSAYD